MKRHITKRRAAAMTVVAILLGAVAAFAYFSSTGSGTGSAHSGTASNVTITQIGAGYDSLIPNSGYHQDQCMNTCSGVTEIGNDVTLANSGDQQLISVVVAADNWNLTTVTPTMTLSIPVPNGPNGPITPVTENSQVLAAGTAGGPTTTNVTFDFSTQNAWVGQEFVYGIQCSDCDTGAGVNLALSSSATNVSVGTDTHPGSIYVDSTVSPGSPLGTDFPTCADAGTGFALVNVDCGPSNPGNPGAYGNEGAASADIPAVEFNVVGGTETGLAPGGPSDPINFAITNPGSSSVYVNSVTTTVSSVTTNADIPTCSTLWYSIANSPVTIGENIPPGTTFFDNTGVTISMPPNVLNQDSCEGNAVTLGFTSN